ncbi:hypothetical protein [Vibrio anguillarum]|uniref:hypothetical protein n=2 Tax=Vibrio anguillarum TaxID=55601 RepID=UPI0018FEF062|nr:hypothetical protein [Vibrio anguillarum]MBF4424446.1 hypothetical protein [Vibrio anguillarum]
METKSELHTEEKHRRYALSYLDNAGDLHISYLNIADNQTVVAASKLLGLELSYLYPPECEDLFTQRISELTTLELLNFLTRIKNRLFKINKRIDETLKLFNSSIGIELSQSDLVEKASIEFKNFHKSHVQFVEYIDNSYLHLILQSLIDLNNTNKESFASFKDDIYSFTNQGIEEIDNYQKGVFNQIDVKSRILYQNLEDIKRELQHQDEKMLETAHGLIEQLDKNFASQQSTNLEVVTNQTRASVNEIQVTAQNAANQFHKQVDSQISQIKSRIDKEVSQFETHKVQIESILGDISNAHQSNANRIQADKEKQVADTLRMWGVIALILVIFFSLYLFNSYLGFFGETKTTDSQLTTQWFLVRFLTITLLTGPFIYLLKESASHRAKENLYRQRGTQLSSIGAYLSELDIQERTLLKKELAKNFFSFHDGKTDTQNVPDFLRDMKQLVIIAKSINGSQNIVSNRLRRK